MAINSWTLLDSEDKDFFLSEELRQKDPFRGTDIGWVSQMRPFIREFSKEGDVVLDPFSGLGTTLISAAIEKRHAFGIEREKARVELIKQRWDEFSLNEEDLTIHDGDCVGTLRHLLTKSELREISLSLTSVPYFDSAWKGSSQEGQLYAQSNYQTYLNYFTELCYLLKRSVKEEGYVIMIAENVRDKEGRLLPIAWDIASIMQSFFNVYDERVIIYNKASESSGMPQIHTNRSHEYVIIAENKMPTIRKGSGEQYLESLSKEFDFILHGGFAALLDGTKKSTTDIDLIMENNTELKRKLISYLTDSGFALFSQDLKSVNRNDEIEDLRFLRSLSKEIRQLDIIFLDEPELKKLPVKNCSFKRVNENLRINSNWKVN